MISTKQTLLIAATSLLSVACGSNISFPGNGGSGGHGASGGGLQCEDLIDQAPADTVTVTMRNVGDDPIFLGSQGCSASIDLTVTDPEGGERIWRNDGCTFTCEQLQEHSGVCAGDCAVPPVIMVAPGGAYELVWTGILYEETTMSEACFFEPQFPGPAACYQQRVAVEGDYTLSTKAWPSASGCQEVYGCTCTPDANGVCQLEDFAFVDGEPSTVSGVVNYPSETAVEITFGN